MQQVFSDMKLKIIRTKKDYLQALERLELIFDAKKGTPEGDEVEILGMFIEQYENGHFPIDLPDPIEAIKFRREQLGYTQNDLAKVVGLKSRANEILNRKENYHLK